MYKKTYESYNIVGIFFYVIGKQTSLGHPTWREEEERSRPYIDDRNTESAAPYETQKNNTAISRRYYRHSMC